MAEESTDANAHKNALAVLGVQIQTHERYHTQKEQMTWLVSAGYIGLTMLVVGHDPFWKEWQPYWFVTWLLLLFVTSLSILVFLHLQFQDRHRASAFFLAANDVAVQWATAPPESPALRPKPLSELDDMLVFAAVDDRFRQLFHGRSSLPSRVAFFLAAVWTVAAATYMVVTYCGSH